MQNSHISIVAEDDTQIEVSFTDGTWSCPLCCDTPVFASEPQVTNHVISVHQSKSVTFEGLRYLKCNLGCDVLRQRMHYHCSQCDKAVISRGDFVFHLKSHRIPGQHRAGRRKGLAKTLNTNVSKIQLFSNSCAIVSANIIPLIEDPEAFWSDLESETGMNCLRDAVSNSFVLLQGPYHGIQKAYSIIEKYLITRLEKDMDLTDLASSHLISAADYQRPSGSLITAHATSPTELPERRSSRKRKVNSLFTDYVTPSTVDVEAQSSSHMQRPVAAPADLTSSHNDIIYALKSTVSQRCTVTLTKQPESDSEMYKLNMTFSRPELQGPVLEELKAEPIEDEPSSDEEEVEPNQCHSSVTIETIYAVPNTARSETVSVQATHASTSSSDSVLLDTKPLSLETSSVPEVHTESITEQYVLIQNVPESVKPIPSPKITFRCEECAKEFISLTKLIEHRKDCDQSKKTQNKTTPKPVEIIMPEKSFTKQHVCHKCGFEATVPQELKLHIARRHEEKTLRCEDCGEMFGPMIDLKYHIKNTGHAGGECANLFRRMVNCHICDKSLQMKNLRAHISMVHDKLRRYQCEICQKQFGTKFTLTEHMDIHKTEDERRRRFVCPVCHQAFFKKLPLDEHMSKHEGKPAYSCDICEKKFYHQSGYKRHMQHHSNVRAFVCRICGKGFKTSTNLSAHKSVHRPNQFICMCGKSYHQKHTLKLHQEKCLTHQDMMAQRLTEQQYPSTVTSGDVILPSSNATLLNLQSSDVPKYMCGFCKETFVHFSDVQEHVRLHVQEATDQLVDLDESQVGVSSQLRQLVEQETLSTDAHLVQQETLPSHTHFEQQETLPVHTQHDIHLHDTNGDTQGRSILVSEEQLQQLVDLEGSQTI